MNTRRILDSASPPFALSVSFNSDNSFFSVALENGFRVLASASGETQTSREVGGGGIGIAEMLSTTRYLALVGGGQKPKFPQNHVHILNDATESVVTRLEVRSPVQRVRISKTHLVVVQKGTVGIYKLKTPPVKIADYETANNPFGLCCLGKNLVVFPGLSLGQLRVFDLNTHNVSIIPAHNSPLRAIALSRDEEMVATASEQGTLVRVWAFPSTTKVTEFRRGVDPAAILSLAFSPNRQLLAATSDKSTLHIFDLVRAATPEPDPKTHKWGVLSKVPLLPRPFSDRYASATIKFELGDEPIHVSASKSPTIEDKIRAGIPGGSPTKGLVGWLDDNTLVIVGAGHDARWEKFVVSTDETGHRVIGREGWKQYLD